MKKQGTLSYIPVFASNYLACKRLGFVPLHAIPGSVAFTVTPP
jgi:hypothetical protein